MLKDASKAKSFEPESNAVNEDALLERLVVVDDEEEEPVKQRSKKS
jgi:hypothetical protein